MSQELLIPDVTQAPSGCLFPLTVYTVDDPNYKYQFIGYPFSFSSDPTLSAIAFRIDSYDDDIYVRDPKTKHIVKLRLFRKFPKLSEAKSSVLPPNKRMKRRDWMTANVSSAEPLFLSSLTLKLISLPGSASPPCKSIVAWKYVVHAGGRDYTFRWNGRNALDVTIHDANQFALGENGSAYLIDDDGKERKVQLAVASKSP